MSDYHILNGRPDGNQYTVVFHLSVPNENNAVGINKRVALVQMLSDPETSQMPKSRVPFIEPSEQTQLDAGELYELVWQYDTHPGVSIAERLAELDGKFAVFSTSVATQLDKQLGFWGFSRDVP